MVVLPWRLSLLLSLSPVAFSLAFLLWAIDNGVDCSPSCSTYQDITAVVMGVAAVATVGGIVAGLVAIVRKLWWNGEEPMPPKPTPH
jgi:hypothetical protein